jgi:hypothetical protein
MMSDSDPDREAAETTDEIDHTLIDWFLTLSPRDRLQASANWARLAALRRVEAEND